MGRKYDDDEGGGIGVSTVAAIVVTVVAIMFAGFMYMESQKVNALPFGDTLAPSPGGTGTGTVGGGGTGTVGGGTTEDVRSTDTFALGTASELESKFSSQDLFDVSVLGGWNDPRWGAMNTSQWTDIQSQWIWHGLPHRGWVCFATVMHWTPPSNSGFNPKLQCTMRLACNGWAAVVSGGNKVTPPASSRQSMLGNGVIRGGFPSFTPTMGGFRNTPYSVDLELSEGLNLITIYCLPDMNNEDPGLLASLSPANDRSRVILRTGAGSWRVITPSVTQRTLGTSDQGHNGTTIPMCLMDAASCPQTFTISTVPHNIPCDSRRVGDPLGSPNSTIACNLPICSQRAASDRTVTLPATGDRQIVIFFKLRAKYENENWPSGGVVFMVGGVPIFESENYEQRCDTERTYAFTHASLVPGGQFQISARTRTGSAWTIRSPVVDMHILSI